MKKQLLLVFTFLLSVNLFAGNYYFKINLGIGTADANEILLYYQLTDISGSKGLLTPYTIRNINSIDLLKVRMKKSRTKFIDFEGYVVESNGTRKPILRIQFNMENLKTGESNSTLVDLNAVSSPPVNPKPLTEFISEIERKNYLNILKKKKNEVFNYNNFFPLGKFILYDPSNKVSIDAITVGTNSSEYVESSKSIKDHYLLKKKAGENLDVKYAKLANASLNNSKQQYIEYLIEINEIQVLHWQSDKSVAEYLYERYKNNNLGILVSSFESNPNYKLYFVSSCVKINDFIVSTAVHDSISTVAEVNANINFASNTLLTVSAGVIYSRDEAATTKESTNIYYTGFRVRDYTDFVKGLILNLSLSKRLGEAKIKFNEQERMVKNNFENLKDLDNSLMDFESASVISRFFENIEIKEFSSNEELSDSLNRVEKIKIDAYNALLEELKESIIEYKNIKNYLKSLETTNANESGFIGTNPKEKRLEDGVIESLIQ